MRKKRNHPTLDSEYGLFGYFVVLAIIGLGFAYSNKKQRQDTIGEKEVLDAAQINGLPVGVDENGKLIVFNNKPQKR